MPDALTPLDASILRYLSGSGDPSVEERCQRLAEHGVALLAAARLGDRLPAEVRRELTSATYPWLMSTMRSEAALATAVDALVAADVRHVVLKGRALADLWRDEYGGQDLRTFTDVDLLVDPVDRARAERALVDAGFHRSAESAGEVGLVNAAGASIDLHWLLVNDIDAARRFRLDSAQILSSGVVWDGLTGRLDAVWTLLHTALHAVISDLARVAACVDVHVAARVAVEDAGALVDTARRHRLSLVAAVALDRAERWCRPAAPSRLPRRLAGWSPWFAVAAAVSRRGPDRYLQEGWSGGEFFRHTLDTSWRSVAALLSDTGINVETQRELRAQRRAAA